MKLPRKKRPALRVSPPSSPEESPLHSPRPSRGKKVRNYVDNWWLWELFGLILATGCLSAIVGILAKYHGQSLSQWPYSITLNSLLAFLSAVSKSSLLIPVAAGVSQLKWTRFNQRRGLIDLQRFDDASRGPLGSLMLLFRGGWLAFIGALIIIAALAIEPFVQQIVSYPVRSIESTVELATVPRTSEYNRYAMTNYGGGANINELVPDLKASIYTGIYGSGTQVQPTCISGNCSWPSFDSLAVCSSCVDVTQSITIFDVKEFEVSGSADTACNMSLPISRPEPVPYRSPGRDQLEVRLEYAGNSDLGTLPFGTRMTMNMVPGITGLVDKHNRINSSMSTFTTIYYSNGYSTDCTRDHGKVTATECMLYWCIQSLSTEVKSSVLTETSTSPRSMIHNTTQPRREFYLDDNGVRYYVSKDGGFGAQGVESFLMNDIFSAGNATNKYGTNAGASNDIVSILSNKAFDHYGNSKSTGNTTGTAGLSEIVTRVADSMSANIRTAVTYDNTSRPAIGTTWEQETFINVRWPWLILPLLLDVLALVFLVFVVVSTKRSNTQVWKSSQMVTIFHGFTFREQMDMEKAHGMIDMEDVARSIEVRLVPTGEGKRLSKVP